MATPATPEARTAAWHHLKQFLREQEAEHRRLLSMWVSELEPEFVYSRTAMAVMGITVKGWDTIVIYARGWTRSAQVSHDYWMTMAFNPVRHYPVPRDFHWDVGLDLAATDDLTVYSVRPSELKINVSAKDFDPELGRKLLAATMPRVKK